MQGEICEEGRKALGILGARKESCLDRNVAKRVLGPDKVERIY